MIPSITVQGLVYTEQDEKGKCKILVGKTDIEDILAQFNSMKVTIKIELE
jgi:hypothetical protein